MTYVYDVGSIIDRDAERLSRELDAKVGVGFKDLDRDYEHFYNPDERFLMASVFKLYVLVELYNQALKGLIRLDDRVTIREGDKVPGSGVIQHLSAGATLALRDLANLMMIFSDNTATDIILGVVGKDRVNETIKELGLSNTKVVYSTREIICKLAGVNDVWLAIKKLRSPKAKLNVEFLKDYTNNNVSSPRDTVRILELLHRKKILNPGACSEIIETMKKCQTGEARIKYYLPHYVEVAHKTGTMPGVVNDVGIVYSKRRSYILVVYLNELFPKKRKAPYLSLGESFIANLSYKIHNAVKRS